MGMVVAVTAAVEVTGVGQVASEAHAEAEAVGWHPRQRRTKGNHCFLSRWDQNRASPMTLSTGAWTSTIQAPSLSRRGCPLLVGSGCAEHSNSIFHCR